MLPVSVLGPAHRPTRGRSLPHPRNHTGERGRCIGYHLPSSGRIGCADERPECPRERSWSSLRAISSLPCLHWHEASTVSRATQPAEPPDQLAPFQDEAADALPTAPPALTNRGSSTRESESLKRLLLLINGNPAGCPWSPGDCPRNRERGGVGGKREKGRRYWPECENPAGSRLRGSPLTNSTTDSVEKVLAQKRSYSPPPTG